LENEAGLTSTTRTRMATTSTTEAKAESEGGSSELASVYSVLQTLQLQNEKLAKYQEISYRWHQQVSTSFFLFSRFAPC